MAKVPGCSIYPMRRLDSDSIFATSHVLRKLGSFQPGRELGYRTAFVQSHGWHEAHRWLW
jgi:hypothetical protein